MGRRDHRRDMAARRAAVRGFLRATGVDEIAVSTDGDYMNSLVRFFKRRGKLMAQ